MESAKKPKRNKHFSLAGKIFGSYSSPHKFTIRGSEITRIETLSDAVFAFTISLLIMALEVPQTFEELKQILYSFLPFAATVALVFLFWYQQHRYFRHYGIDNVPIIVLNAVLLVLVLFYVYPLKFLFSLLFGMVTHINYFPKATANGETVLTAEDFPQLVLIYSIGYAAIWMVFYLLYRKAWLLRKALKLNSYETEDTHKQLRGSLLNVLIGIAAGFFAWLGYAAVGGICFLFIIPVLAFNAALSKRKLGRLHPASVV